MLAGVVGATAAGAAMSGRADAATGDNVVQGTLNNVGTGVPATEIAATNDDTGSVVTPTVILTNDGGNATDGFASPPLRITPAGSGLVIPSESTVGGDLVATGDGELWFTHGTSAGIFPATVHTDANSDSFVPLSTPYRILDTRSASLRTSILNASGNLNSSGQLLKGKTIHINLNLNDLVIFGEAVVANLTITAPASNGDVTVFPGGSVPNASSINFVKGQTVANMSVSGIAEYSSTVTDSIAITTTATTHVILDIAGFFVANILQVSPSFTGASASGSASVSRAQQAGAVRIRRAIALRDAR